MKKIFTLLCVAFLATSLLANVVTGTCGDNLQWAYDTDTHALTITGSGDMYWSGERPWAQVAGEITSVSLPDGLTSIESSAFDWCSALTSVTIPNSVTSIGNYAFYECSSLASITIPNSVTSIGDFTFFSCSSLTSVTIPNSVTSIGSSAFDWCSALTSVTIPNSVTSIGNYAFRGCSSLTSVTIPNSVISIGSGAFYHCSQVTMQGTTPPSISASTFSDNATIFVPCSAMDAYLAAPVWQFLDLNGLSHHVTLNATEGGSAQITAANCESNNVTIEAYASDNYQFKQWSDGNTDNPRTITLTSNITLTAEFEEIPYYSVTISGNYIDGYVSIWDWYFYTESSAVQFEVQGGTEVYFYEKSNCGSFLGWSDGVTERERTIVITSDTTISSIFEASKYYTVNISGDNLCGSYEVVGGMFCNTHWTEFYNNSSLQLTMREGTSITFSDAYVGECGNWTGWSDGVTERERTIVITSDTTIYSIIEYPELYTVNISGDRICGYYSGYCGGSHWEEYYGTSSVQLFVNEGTSITVREEGSCGTWLGWSDGVTDKERTIFINSDTTISSIFEASKYYTVNISGENLWGSYEVEGGILCNTHWNDFYNESSLQLTMREGTSISVREEVGCGTWLGWSDGVTDNQRTIVITSDTTIYSIIEEPKYYTVNISGNSLSGSYEYEIEGCNTSWSDFYYESSLQLTMREGTSISVREDDGCGTWLGWSDGVTENERTIVITSDTTISSRFDVETYSVSITAGEGGYLENGNIEREYNECNREWIYNCAYANEGYYFVGWSDGNTNNCIDIYPDTDINLVAQFAPKMQVTVLVGVDNASKDMGSVSGSGIYYSGDYVTISATPNAGYHFVEWSDGNGNATRELYLQSDTTLFATFAPGECGGKCGENLYWTYGDNTITITGSGDMDLYAYSAWHNDYDWYYNVTAVQFPEGITSIDDYAFYEMSLTSVVVPASVTHFGENAFAYNNNLTRFEYLGTEAECEINYDGFGMLYQSHNLLYFKGQKDMLSYRDSYAYLDTVIITGGTMYEGYYHTTYIDNSNANNTYFEEGYLRDDVLAVETLLLPNGLLEIGDFALHNARHLEQITIPAGVTRIGESAFEECRSLESVTFAGKALREIDDWAFYNCHTLKNITIPEGVTSIGKAAFFDCSYLKEITLPSTVQTIADNAFGQCQKVGKMTVNAMTPPVVEAETFEDIDRSIPLYVPIGTALQYKAADYWCEFFNVIEYNAPTAIDNIPSSTANTHKLLRNGQLLIIRDGKTYNTMGAEIR